MQLGIDYGTTRIVCAVADRGNYPLIPFEDGDGDARPYLPATIAEVDGELVFGFRAEAAARVGAPALRSLKRRFADGGSAFTDEVAIGSYRASTAAVLTAQLTWLREVIGEQLGDDVGARTALVAVPAHAPSAQRLLTLDAFRSAGFRVAGLLNEPSAAAVEYAHRYATTFSGRRTGVLVFDFGGGTFDASLVTIAGGEHTIIDSRGDNALGGDDLDEAILALALRAAGLNAADLDAHDRWDLTEQVRLAKEALTAQTRRLLVDSPAGPIVLDTAEVYAATAPIIARTLDVIDPLLSAGELGADVAGLYLVGGASDYPAVGRTLRAAFGHRVRRSPYPAASTAIGLAIAADPAAGVRVRDVLARSFGVFRERAGGADTAFDVLFTPDTPAGTRITRRYTPVHTLGHFRFVECTRIEDGGEPGGTLSPLSDVLVPFTADLQAAYPPGDPGLRSVAVERAGTGGQIEETYEVDASGQITATIEDLVTGYRVRADLTR